MKITKKGIERKSEKLWKELARDRAGHACEYCGATENLVVHHIVNKSHSRLLRWDNNNSLVLCRYHHDRRSKFSPHSDMFFAQRIFQEWIGRHISEDRLVYLEEKREQIQRVTLTFVEDEYSRLEELAEDNL